MAIYVLAAVTKPGTKKQEVVFYMGNREPGQPYTTTHDINEAAIFDKGTSEFHRSKNAMGAMGGVANNRDVYVVEIEVN